MKIEVKYWKEASDLMEILIENGYKVEIATKANYPFEDLYVVTIDNRIDENE